MSDNLLMLCLISAADGIPKITSSISLCDQLYVTVVVDGSPIPHNQYRDLCPDSRVENISQLVNMMARLKSWNNDVKTIPVETRITKAVNILQNLEDDDERHRHIEFFIDQIRLTMKTKYSRVYSAQLLIMS